MQAALNRFATNRFCALNMPEDAEPASSSDAPDGSSPGGIPDVAFYEQRQLILKVEFDLNSAPASSAVAPTSGGPTTSPGSGRLHQGGRQKRKAAEEASTVTARDAEAQRKAGSSN